VYKLAALVDRAMTALVTIDVCGEQKQKNR